MRVAVLGAGGTIGRAIVRDLAESEEVSELTLLDRDAGRLGAIAGPGERVVLDANEGLAAALEGCEVLVNAADYRVNLAAMQAALEVGSHYIDLGGLYWMTAQQLELDERFVAANRLAALGMGASPGKTNVMAELAVRSLGEAPAEIRISAAGRDPGASEGLRLPYALRTLIDELTLGPVVLEDGVPKELAPRAGGGVVDFPPPIGPAETMLTLHSELQTLGRSFKVANASFRLSLPPELVARLEGLLDAGDEALAAASAESLPQSAETIATHVVEARAASGRVARVSAVTGPHREWGLGGGIVSTAAPAAALVRLIARGRIEPVGALPPEDCVNPEDLFPELEARGCAFTVTVS